MELRWWWMAAALLGAAVLVVAYALAARPRRARTPGAATRAAHTDRLHRIPLYRTLARRHLRRLLAQVACAGVALLGATLLAARLAQPDPAQLHSRDIILCLDVSGSMRQVDAEVVDSYRRLADQLRDERIGFVMFDSSAVTVFPLTSDAGFIRDQLRTARDRLAAGDDAFVTGTREAGVGSSLVGDGLASCTQRFDNAATGRPRSVVLATDNIVNGQPIYPLDQATALAQRAQVMVFAIGPDTDAEAELAALQDQARRTGGDLLRIRSGEASDVGRITAAVESRQKALLAGGGPRRLVDQPWPGAVLVALGLVGGTLVGRPRPAGRDA